MNELTPNPILEFNPNQMLEVRKLFDYADINRLQQDINIFEDWIRMQHHFLVKEYDKPYLERYLINSKGSIERAKKLLDKICTFRGLMPEFLQGFDIENEFQNMFKVMVGNITILMQNSSTHGLFYRHICVLPKPTAENHRILLYTVHDSDTALFDHHEVTRYILLVLQYLQCHDYNAGIHMICDSRKFTLGIITKLSPMLIANTIMIMTEALGLRLRGIHLISGSKFIDAMVAIVKQGLSKKVTTRFHVYDDYESLYKVIPKNMLPSDIGGDLDSTEEIVKNNFKEFCSPAFIKHIKHMESAATNESERLSSKFNEAYSGMPGSFKVLTVD